MCSRICDSLPPSLPASHMKAYLRGLLCTKCGAVQAALEPPSGYASTLPTWSMLCYAVLCLLSLARGGGGQCAVTHGTNIRWFDQDPCR